MIVVSFINMKGGVAKTTLAVNFADCLAKRHQKKVLLIDVDPQFNATQCLMSPNKYMEHLHVAGDTVVSIFDRNRRAVGSTVGSTTSTEPKTLDSIEVVRTGEFDLLPGNLDLYRLEMAPGSGTEYRLKNYLETIKDKYDYIIIDTPPTPSVWMTSALIASNHYLIPVKADPISLTGIDLLKNIIDERRENFSLKLSCAGLILTLIEENTTVYKDAEKNLRADVYWNKYLYKHGIPKRTEIAKKQLEQIHILNSNNPQLKGRLSSIVNEFINRIESNG